MLLLGITGVILSAMRQAHVCWERMERRRLLTGSARRLNLAG
jgi:hypothetical protein